MPIAVAYVVAVAPMVAIAASLFGLSRAA